MINLNRKSDSELWAAAMCGFHFALRIGELEQLEDKDISFCEIDGYKCISITIRGSKTDQCHQGVQRTLLATNCPLCPVNSIARWLDRKAWHPKSGDRVFGGSIARKLNEFLKTIALEMGIDTTRISCHSLRAGCATTLYANGIDPIDIQRWGRWKSPIYMRYVWHGNVKLHTLSLALVKGARLTNQLLAPENNKRKVTLDQDYRCGGKRECPDDLWDLLDQHLDDLVSPGMKEELDQPTTGFGKIPVLELTKGNLEKLEKEEKCLGLKLAKGERSFESDKAALGKFEKEGKCYGAKLVKRERSFDSNESESTWVKEKRREDDFVSDSEVEERISKKSRPSKEWGSDSHTAVTAEGGDEDLSLEADNPFQSEGSKSDEEEQEIAGESSQSRSGETPRITNTDEVQTEQTGEREVGAHTRCEMGILMNDPNIFDDMGPPVIPWENSLLDMALTP